MKFITLFSLTFTSLFFFQAAAENTPVKPSGEKTLPVDFKLSRDATAQELFTKVCSNCHGKKGEGSEAIKAPSIAGLPSWYVETQINKFRSDLRGASAADPTGQIMHNIITAIDGRQTAGLAKLIAALPMHPTQNQLGGDAKKGKEVFMSTCAQCHRFNGKGEIVFGSAPLIGLQDWYIRAQIYKFRKGIRGGNPADEKGHKMHQMTQYITDEQAADVTAHIAVLAKKYANTLSRRDIEFEEMRKRKETENLNQDALPPELEE